MEFEGKIALVTGTSGIALGTALHLAGNGARVHMCGIDQELNNTAADQAGGLPVEIVELDICDRPAVEGWIRSVGEASGIDILVNSAAVQTYGTTETTDMAHWDRVIETNLTGYFLTSHFAYPYLKASGAGSIVHVASVQGHANQNEVVAYATAKGAIHALVRAQAVDAAKDGIRVNSVSPGSIRTPLLEFAARSSGANQDTLESKIAEFGHAHPMGRVGTVEEVAELIGFICSEKAGFCTGGDWLIDGGLTAHIGV